MFGKLRVWREERRRSVPSQHRPSVAFLMEYVPAYREPFYGELGEELERRGIDFHLCVGNPAPPRAQRNDAVIPEGSIYNESWFANIKGRQLKLQRFPKEARSADLLVVQQEAGNLINYVLPLRARMGKPFAVWGHGEDPDPRKRSDFSEGLKGIVSRRACRAFAYTDRSGQVFESIGVPPDLITVTNNSMHIETDFAPEEVDPDLGDLLASVSQRTDRIGWFVSAMHPGKRLDVLMAALDAIRDEVPDFEFFFIGEGMARHEITDFCATRNWAHDMGARRGDEKAAIGSIARLMLMTGIVGLHVLDAFAFGSPLVTAAGPSNSHELDYLVDGVNGILLPEGAGATAFAEAVSALLNDRDRHAAMCEQGRLSSLEISVDAMATRFADGIELALGRSPRV